jgi:hypothetical protein
MPVAGQLTYSPASTTDIHHSAMSILHPKEHSELKKCVGHYPFVLSTTNIYHIMLLIPFFKAKNASM